MVGLSVTSYFFWPTRSDVCRVYGGGGDKLVITTVDVKFQPEITILAFVLIIVVIIVTVIILVVVRLK